MHISVIVPVYNARRTIALCVDALLAQTQHPDAIYLVDNGSTDGTYEWLQERATGEPRLRILREEKRGQSAARNAALALVTEGTVAFTDADCVPEPDWLSNLAAAYTGPEVAAVAGSIGGYRPHTLVDRYLSIVGFSLPNSMFVVRKCTPFVGFPTANLSVQADVLRRVGEFDEGMSLAEDFDLCWRILKAGGSIVYAPRARVGHIHRSTLQAMLKRTFQYGTARPALMHKHFRGIAYAVAGRCTVEARGRVTLCVNLTSPEKVSIALIVLSILSPWFLALLAMYWVRLARRLKKGAQQQGVSVRSGGELALLTGLHLLEFCASDAGRLIASPRYRVLCV